jgi:hypothetical protein
VIGLLIKFFVLAFVSPVTAAPVTFSFISTVTAVSAGTRGNLDPLHPLLGTIGTGTFSYETNDVGSGAVTLPPGTGAGQFQITFEIFGQAFTESDDMDFPIAPELRFVDGLPIALDFIISENPSVTNPVAIAESGVLDIAMGPESGFGWLTETAPGSGIFTTTAQILATPIPPAIWLFSSGMVGLIGISRRKKSA